MQGDSCPGDRTWRRFALPPPGGETNLPNSTCLWTKDLLHCSVVQLTKVEVSNSNTIKTRLENAGELGEHTRQSGTVQSETGVSIGLG